MQKITIVGVTALLLAAGTCRGQAIQRVTTSGSGVQGSENSQATYVTPNGRWVVFNSSSDTLVPGDNNHVGSEVFVKDRLTGTTVRVSVPDLSTGNLDANNFCYAPDGVRCMSDDGRYIVFSSPANNLVVGDTQLLTDIFVRDRDADGDGIFDEPGPGNTNTTRVNLTSGGLPATPECDGFACGNDSLAPSMSADGRFVAFTSVFNFTSAPEWSNVFVRDRDPDANGIMDEPGGVTILASPLYCSGCNPNEGSQYTSLSASGRYVAFLSNNMLLVPGDTNQRRDVFVRDLVESRTIRVSLDTDETQGSPASHVNGVSISDDGRFVLFASSATLGAGPGVPIDTNGLPDIFLRDLDPNGNGLLDEVQDDPATPGVVETEGTTRVVSLGTQYNPVTMQFDLTRLNAAAGSAILSGDGRFVAYQTNATNVLCGPSGCGDAGNDTDVYVVDVVTNQTRRASVTFAEPNADVVLGGLSHDGAYVLMNSTATNLSGTDTNASVMDGYLRAGLFPPANDACTAATPILAGTTWGDTTGMGVDGNSSCNVNNPPPPDVYYSFTSRCSGSVTIDTIGSGYNTVLSVHSGCPATVGNEVVCNNDISSSNPASRVTLLTTDGRTYYIRVSGHLGAAGLFALNVGPCIVLCPCDVTRDGILNSQDLFGFLELFFLGGADYNADGVTDSQDFFDFIACFFSRC
ncbi:MAG: hypothetical protein H7210_01645 [Pyrinomonadaceae bacterium]|nr:hypothetical protein [Phycisphaerales bacterium]